MNIGQWVHFSVDGTIECFKWIYENKPVSIFSEPMLAELRNWHQMYHLSCDLYVLEQSGPFNIEQLQDIYWKELKKESDWLKLVWQGKEHQEGQGLNLDLASLDRVYKLITKKADRASWGSIVRVYEDVASEALMEHLKQYGIKLFLVNDIKKNNYQLTKQNKEALQKQGYLTADSIDYWKTNLCFDTLEDEMEVERLLQRTETEWALAEYPMKPFLDVFFHESMFESIVQNVNKYWERLSSIKIPLITNAGTLIGREFYFTTCNTSELYALDVEAERIDLVAKLPCDSGMKFLSLIHYDGHIWMVPACEKNILVFNIRKKNYTVFPLPFLSQEKEERFSFGACLADGQYMWLSPKESTYIVRIDMEKRQVDLFSEWPAGVEFHSESKSIQTKQFDFGKIRNFKSMELCENRLYFFRDNCSHNISMGTDTCKMSILDVDISEHYGITLDKNTLLASPARKGDTIRLISLDTREVQEIAVPDWVWGDNKFYAFWYAKRLYDGIYILPRGAKAIIRYGITDGCVDFIKIDFTGYSTLFPSGSVALTDIFDYDGEKWLFPYRGNALFRIDKKNQSLKQIPLFGKLGEVNKCHICERGMVWKEDKKHLLIDYINKIQCLIVQGKWSVIKENGNLYTSGDSRSGNYFIGNEIYRQLI